MKKLKLRQIAHQLGVSVPMLSMYENDVVNLRKDKESLYRDIILSHRE
ncbi:hypothetical protein [Paenibacillus sp. R14(2021)]